MHAMLKEVGVELPLACPGKAELRLRILYDGVLCCEHQLRRAHLPVHAPLTAECRALLACDKRRRGEHRPPRLVLGRCDRSPYQFHAVRLPGGGLELPHDELQGHVSLVLWIQVAVPLLPHPVLFHLKGSDPVAHPFGFVRWVAHRRWTGAERLGAITASDERTSCGCGARVRLTFAPLAQTLALAERLQAFADAIPPAY